MINVKFYHSPNGTPLGFKISGHSGYASHGNDIVCSAVSSAAYMTANTIIEIMRITPSVKTDDGMMQLRIPEGCASQSNDILRGFELHITELSLQYPKNITITTTEV